ncbi:YncE family protein [Chryseobacterium sp. JUb7]|uniref:YncE family protein n=1 Tax=Chryseobacterium sp. JUb7 TaxID=2940599 RepID=UPI00216A4891|nr:YncE family protein [Chryseobacterium sp. JUb7]MCS3531614.1 YVTN family beta-propeller protein [Chryseobacterium sp. JUb7]
MKNYYLKNPLKVRTTILFLGLTLAYSCNDDSMDSVAKRTEEKIVVANRNGKSISFIDVDTNKTTNTLLIPNSEPMYVVYVPKTDKIYVGDRSEKKVHVINPENKQVERSIAAGEGIFHMWADGQGKKLWVVNDIENTISVINLSTNTVSKTIAIDMKPHDVFVTQDGSKAFVSVLTGNPASDKVYIYSTDSYLKTGELTVGKEPHLFHSASNRLYVPCQSGKVYAFDSQTLNSIFEKNYPGAHGIFHSPNQNNIFVSNITGNQLYSINSATGEEANTPAPVSSTPHNIVVNNDGNKMFVTNSGVTSTSLSVYHINSSGAIAPSASVNVGTNPFGLTYYKRELN